jgi:Domain of unknown function (DUF4136)
MPRPLDVLESIRDALAVALALLLAAAAAAGERPRDHATAPGVELDYNRGLDFSVYRSYAWATFQDPPKKASDHIRITTAVEKALAERGLVKAEPSLADVLVRYQGQVAKQLRSSATQEPSSWQPSSSRVVVGFHKVPVASLRLELWDPRRKDVVWSAKTEQVVSPGERSDEALTELVPLLLESYPPRPSARPSPESSRQPR